MANYIEPDRLAELVTLAQTSGRASEELALAIGKIASGVWLKFGGKDSGMSEEDFVQAAVLHMLPRLKFVDVEKNVFAYFTTICRQKLRQTYVRGKQKECAFKRYKDEMAAAHVWELRWRLDYTHRAACWRTEGNSRQGW